MKITDVEKVTPIKNSDFAVIYCKHDSKNFVYITDRNNHIITSFENTNLSLVRPLIGAEVKLFAITDKQFSITDIIRVENDRSYTHLQSYDTVCSHEKGGYFEVTKNDLVGLINTMGEEIISPQYDDILLNIDASLIPVEKNGYWGIIDKQNNILVPFNYKSIDSSLGGYFKCVRPDSTIHIRDVSGKIVYKAERLINVFNLGNGTLLVENKTTGEYKFVNLEKGHR